MQLGKWHIFFFSLVILLPLRYLLYIVYTPKITNGQLLSFHTTLLDEPQNIGKYYRVSAYYGNVFGSQKIVIYYSENSTLNYGETISISGKVENKVINNKNAFLAMYFPKIEAVPEEQNSFLQIISSIRQQIKNFYFQSLEKTDAGLLLGIVLGLRANFPKDFSSSLRSGGVMHVIAASGMNVSMVAGVLFSLTRSLMKRQIGILFSIFGVIFYAFLSGLQASILRAAIMACLVFSSQLLGKQYTAFYALFFTGFIMLFIHPSLLFDIGFQLSIGSTLGILTIRPLLLKNKIFDDISTTISAQLATTPILLMSFGQYGVLSILVNALVLWTVPPLMILGGIGAIAGLFYAPLGRLFLWMTVPFLWIFEKVVLLFGQLNWNIQFTSFPLFLVLGYYLMLFAVISLLWQRKKTILRK